MKNVMKQIFLSDVLPFITLYVLWPSFAGNLILVKFKMCLSLM